jgi:hypothetical protein
MGVHYEMRQKYKCPIFSLIIDLLTIKKDLDRRIFSLKFKGIYLASIVPLRPTSLFFDRTPSKCITRGSGSDFLTQDLNFLSSCFKF